MYFGLDVVSFLFLWLLSRRRSHRTSCICTTSHPGIKMFDRMFWKSYSYLIDFRWIVKHP